MKKILTVLFLLISMPLWAATYYVSTEGDDSWDGTAPAYVSGTTGPKRTPVAAAALLTSPGDYLYFRGGIYNIDTPSSSRSVAIYPRADHCTFMPYNGEAVTLQGSSVGNYGVAPTNGVIGVGSRSYTMIDGFTIKGIVMLDGPGGYNTVQNCDISVGCDSWSGNEQGELIWVQSDTVTDVWQHHFTIKNCKIHDNGIPEYGGGNAAMVFTYKGTNGLIENCEIYNSQGPGVYFKDSTRDTVVRKCFIHDNALGGFVSAAQGTPRDNEVYQNIFARNGSTSNELYHSAVHFQGYQNGTKIYNNTFYGNYRPSIWVQGSIGPCDFYNNISVVASQYHFTMGYIDTWEYVNYLDYNDYYGGGTWDGLWHGTSYATLNLWQAALSSAGVPGAEAHSVTTDPGFLNASGTYTLATDFKRSSYTANGRGGDYPSVMGAYITGSETIGYSESGSSPSTPTIRAGGIRNGGLRP